MQVPSLEVLIVYGGVPLAAIILTVFVKKTSESDERLKRLRAQDLAVGYDLAVAGILISIVDNPFVRRLNASPETLVQEDVIKSEIILLILFPLICLIGLWAVTTFVRIFGWSDQGHMKKVAVVVPLMYGVLVLVLAINRAAS